MGVRPRRFTEEEVSRLSYELAIARVRIYMKWGFTLEEAAMLVDLPPEQVREGLDKEG